MIICTQKIIGLSTFINLIVSQLGWWRSRLSHRTDSTEQYGGIGINFGQDSDELKSTDEISSHLFGNDIGISRSKSTSGLGGEDSSTLLGKRGHDLHSYIHACLMHSRNCLKEPYKTKVFHCAYGCLHPRELENKEHLQLWSWTTLVLVCELEMAEGERAFVLYQELIPLCTAWQEALTRDIDRQDQESATFLQNISLDDCEASVMFIERYRET
ncbi:hypothetical protein R1flu_003069 [Riccia fluitans]|uniref:Uncharacterized protein n=1 Tax=Riccia fluitans TaxID=41844 RepID=A0ABD1YBP5_9MARC